MKTPDHFLDNMSAGKAEYISKEGAHVELPFDLNNLFNMQYSFDTLKAAI
jgi:hypothetical protein